METKEEKKTKFETPTMEQVKSLFGLSSNMSENADMLKKKGIELEAATENIKKAIGLFAPLQEGTANVVIDKRTFWQKLFNSKKNLSQLPVTFQRMRNGVIYLKFASEEQAEQYTHELTKEK